MEVSRQTASAAIKLHSYKMTNSLLKDLYLIYYIRSDEFRADVKHPSVIMITVKDCIDVYVDYFR